MQLGWKEARMRLRYQFQDPAQLRGYSVVGFGMGGIFFNAPIVS
jgi:hypothetical protein